MVLILKAINLTVHLVYLGTLYVHPVTRQIFFFLHRGSEGAPLTVTCYEKKATKVVVQSGTLSQGEYHAALFSCVLQT